ncbi:MAG TPA: hypothetical protein VFG33_14890 [Kribbella sp.]|uniref:hypothetical protein n=1 Tax=Kribbella sp. TaxID=1871183 RepID=UPI002D7A166F|nr:hypothetical protein [Kribbella sp.]HET6294669.1 hypothetical protein [Kribbella sp.]
MSADEPDFTQYDRASAARILTEVLADAVLRPDGWLPDSPSRIEPHLTPLEPAAGSHLTTPQLNHLRSRMRPCPAELVTSATHRVMWNDSDGVVNVAHCGPGRLGAVVPVIARETTLVLRRALAADSATRAAADGLSAGERATMAATTTDRDPLEILNVGLETTARALVQHAYLAEQTPYRGPADVLALHEHRHQGLADERRHGVADRPRHQEGGGRVPLRRRSRTLLRRDPRPRLHSDPPDAGNEAAGLSCVASVVGGVDIE